MPANQTGANPHGDMVKKAMQHLKKVDPILHAAALPHHTHIVLNAHRRNYRKNDLFAKLAGSIVSQQLSTKAADTIWGRLKDACGGAVTPEAIKRLRASTLRKAGLSAAKIKTLKELSGAILSRELNLSALRTLPEAEAIAELSRIWGIGRWTAEMFLMFALDREDIFSPGDLALIRSIELLYGIPRNSKPHVYEAVALAWSPHRTFASRILWKLRDVPTPNGMWE
jgi:DNA-3-methyladenine glycosylase II